MQRVDDLFVVEFIGSPAEDPQHPDRVSLLWGMAHFAPVPYLIGKNKMKGNGRLRGRRGIRYKIDCESNEINKIAEDGSDSQDWARMCKLIEVVFPMHAVYINRVWESYADNLVLPRSDYDRIDLTNNMPSNSFWHLKEEVAGDTYPHDPPGHLPMLVVPDGDLEPQHQGEGIYTLDFTLLAADVVFRR